ncbi:MAG: uroporphyrinogen-III C-methyltransferase [Acidobacteria bacterium]|nr:uroporphyrinogen-III C-methyltransferase [Acidobacteriota bacterium]
MSLFPIFVKLDGRRCLVVGAGPVGESKISNLISAGALITIVAPQATRAIRGWAAQGKVEWHAREFQPADLDGAALVIAAVPAEVASAVFAEARARLILCNSVDDPPNCDFYYGAVVNRGDLQIAISTAGHSPFLAQRLRQELEQQFGPEYAGWVRQLGEARREFFATGMDPDLRRQRLQKLASEAPAPAGPARLSATRPGRGHVYLIGAGPGDPELLTLKALRILGQADAVLHDDLLTPEILELIPPAARVECVGKRHNEHQVTQEEINRRLCRYAAAGETVVRLKGGDGAIFGRASEEMDALGAADIPFSIIPGVTAASGAAAAAGVSLTDRRLGSALVFLTAQRCKGNPPPNWKALAALGGAAAIYMPGGHEAELVRELIDGGLNPDTPCFVVSRATRPDEQIVETTVGQLPKLPKLPAPTLLLIGIFPAQRGQACASKRDRESFSPVTTEKDSRSLFGDSRPPFSKADEY